MKTGAFLSTGFFTMILAMDMCDSIHVYGMIDDNYCRWDPILWPTLKLLLLFLFFYIVKYRKQPLPTSCSLLLPTVEPITVLFLTITMRRTESTSAGCTGSTSTHNVGVIGSSLRRPSTPNGQHGTRWILNTRLGASKKRRYRNPGDAPWL